MIFANSVAILEKKKKSRVTFSPGGNYFRAGVINSSQSQMQASVCQWDDAEQSRRKV